MNSIQKKMEIFASITTMIKDTQLMILFMSMYKTEWLIGFMTSPAALVVRPLLGVTLLILAVMHLIRHARAEKQSVELWIVSLFGVSSILLSNISIWGAIISMSTKVAFAAGPWCFLAALAAGLIMQVLLTGWHAYKALAAPDHSIERRHHQQAIVQNTLLGLQFAACIVTMVFAVIVPISAPVSAAFAVLTISLMLSLMIWRAIPHENKLQIKAFFGFGKPAVEKDVSLEVLIQNNPENVLPLQPKELSEPFSTPVKQRSLSFFTASDEVGREDLSELTLETPGMG